MPLSQNPSTTSPLAAERRASSWPSGPSRSLRAWADPENRNGRPNALYSGTTAATGPWLLAERSRVPFCSARTMVTSSPRLPPTTSTLIRPWLRAFSSPAKYWHATARGCCAEAV